MVSEVERTTWPNKHWIHPHYLKQHTHIKRKFSADCQFTINFSSSVHGQLNFHQGIPIFPAPGHHFRGFPFSHDTRRIVYFQPIYPFQFFEGLVARLEFTVHSSLLYTQVSVLCMKVLALTGQKNYQYILLTWFLTICAAFWVTSCSGRPVHNDTGGLSWS